MSQDHGNVLEFARQFKLIIRQGELIRRHFKGVIESFDLEILEVYEVEELISDGYKLGNQVLMDKNGRPYLLCIDSVEDKRTCIYMVQELHEKVKENQILQASDIKIYHVKDAQGRKKLLVGSKL